MMSIGRALMDDPTLLPTDETSLGMAPVIIAEVDEINQGIKETGMSVLMVEGDIDLIGDLADRVYVFDHGVTAFSGDVSGIMNDPNLAKTYLGM